jgi:hypothetical protein
MKIPNAKVSKAKETPKPMSPFLKSFRLGVSLAIGRLEFGI